MTPADLDVLLNSHFAGKIVRKDLTKMVKEGANVPVFVLEYLLGNYCSSQDEEVVAEGLQTVKRVLAENFVRPDEAEKVITPWQSQGLDGCEQPQGLPGLTIALSIRQESYCKALRTHPLPGVHPTPLDPEYSAALEPPQNQPSRPHSLWPKNALR